MKNKELEYIISLCKKIISNIQNLEIANCNSKVSEYVTVTIGAVLEKPHNGFKIWDFFTSADNALYEQKSLQKGKYRIGTMQGNIK